MKMFVTVLSTFLLLVELHKSGNVFFVHGIPANDKFNRNEVSFEKEPEDAFASRNKPAKLICEAMNAEKVFFMCNDDHVEQHNYKTKTTRTGKLRIRVEMEISRSDVDEILGNFTCRCIATSNGSARKIISRDAHIRNAYMKREFITEPYSQHVREGEQVELRCHPPRGQPDPTVKYWIKDGIRIDSTTHNSNYLPTGAGHLIIVRAEIEDGGNFTCVAGNEAGIERFSPYATVTVYAPGEWSDWSSWSTCNGKQCSRGASLRHRKCTHKRSSTHPPIVVNDDCDGGDSVQRRPCSTSCPPPVDGGWASWGSWSECASDCVKFRRRHCIKPAPQHGGRYCAGEESISRSCSDGLCKVGLNSIVLYDRPPIPHFKSNSHTPPPSLRNLQILPVQGKNRPSSLSGSHDSGSNKGTSSSSAIITDVTLLIGLLVAFTFFISILLIIVRILLKRKTPHHCVGGGGASIQPPYGHGGPLYMLNAHQSYTGGVGGGPNNYTANHPSTPCSTQRSSSSSEGGSDSNCSGDLSRRQMMGGGGGGCTYDYAYTNCNGMKDGNNNGHHLLQDTLIPPRPISEHLYEQPMMVLSSAEGGATATHVSFASRFQPKSDTLNSCSPVKAGVYHAPSPTHSSSPLLPKSKHDSGTNENCEKSKPSNDSFSSMSTSSSSSTTYSAQTGDDSTNDILSTQTKKSLSRLLDKSGAWFQLAQAFGADHYTSFLKSQPSPTEALLNLWEARNQNSKPLTALKSLLISIGRLDAAELIVPQTA